MKNSLEELKEFLAKMKNGYILAVNVDTQESMYAGHGRKLEMKEIFNSLDGFKNNIICNAINEKK